MPEADRLSHVLKWQENNAERLRALAEKERKRNSAAGAKYVRERRKVDHNFRVMGNLRGRVRSAVKAFGFRKYKSTRRLLGCSGSELRAYLEKLWQPGMCWENYGEWHIDHIRPCASFNLLDPKQQRECFHFTNLQPMWAMENFRKNSKYLGHRFSRPATK